MIVFREEKTLNTALFGSEFQKSYAFREHAGSFQNSPGILKIYSSWGNVHIFILMAL